MKTLALIGALGAAMTLAACAEDYAYAPPPPPPSAVVYAVPAAAVAPACFYTRDIRNHTVGDDHTIFINVGGRMVYRVETSNSCVAGATSSDPLVMRNPPGSNSVCRPIDLDVGVNMGGFTNHCIVTAIVPMTPDQVAALPPKLRP
ncbi:hypothetical protein [Phenylobacterium sp.]|uniref:hypothetical protein n=1 Tax=Phenylobacterium sp. TaxID=1871053 RepID=UPI002DEF3F0C|nr:hypothetical protein [Phenylobacterium sp.]